ncbi:hypothetical protein BOSE62_130743 [Bosea sp. 62]|nr:hypothetical protein BOSE7B_120767 [Bosea sp. 7B]CAD5274275.1 hypothetical protein BOSE21B_30146 [Bosea sp. 21B]CAD5275466.1 hypothetical protein BOSE46_30010 [Bosea sp. 46]VVT60116.1 hypothetical protein BOS5A_210907 [Bosea sp. EC-HK365B]VXB55957.1 hypothetical protein BOSE62_130743 [Bosea sp. 62]VXC14648.1 hypothetical protein BOSE29B_30139 [Bosea sp. 29B]VXC18053.1 hypothetical protein BOSE127_170406 [Bosea sp. 127]VXC94347.1 hypothetical protein BOSE125_770010 [Bosea sp. 125]
MRPVLSLRCKTALSCVDTYSAALRTALGSLAAKAVSASVCLPRAGEGGAKRTGESGGDEEFTDGG